MNLPKTPTVAATLIRRIIHPTPKWHSESRLQPRKVAQESLSPQRLLPKHMVLQESRVLKFDKAQQASFRHSKPTDNAMILQEWDRIVSMKEETIMGLTYHTVRRHPHALTTVPSSIIIGQKLALIRDGVQWIDISPRTARKDTAYFISPTKGVRCHIQLAHASISPGTVLVAQTAYRIDSRRHGRQTEQFCSCFSTPARYHPRYSASIEKTHRHE